MNDPLLELYFLGDRLGAPAEGMPGATLSYEQMMARQDQYPNGTDESDSVRLFLKFVNGYEWCDDYAAFATGWACYITAHHGAASYGNTWRDLFSLVKSVAKASGQPIGHDKLLEISKDRNSCGNGCLALAYPAWLYAQEVGADAHRLARAVTEVSHAHSVAQRCVAALVDYFTSRDAAVFEPDIFPPAGREWEFTQTASGCLWAAWECAQEEAKGDVIRRALEIGGDLDSVLALSLLLWGVRLQPKWQVDYEVSRQKVIDRKREFIELSRCPYVKAKEAGSLYIMTRDETWSDACDAYSEQYRQCEERHKGTHCLYKTKFPLGLTPSDREYLRKKYRPKQLEC